MEYAITMHMFHTFENLVHIVLNLVLRKLRGSQDVLDGVGDNEILVTNESHNRLIISLGNRDLSGLTALKLLGYMFVSK